MPTPANSTADAVYGQAFNLSAVVRSATTSNPLAGGLTGLSAMVSKNDGAWTTTTNVPVERGTSGWVSLDLTASEMTATKIDVQIVATNTGAVYACMSYAPVVLSPFTGRFDAQAILRTEQAMMDLVAFLYGGVSYIGSQMAVSNVNGSPKVVGSVIEGDAAGQRSALS